MVEKTLKYFIFILLFLPPASLLLVVPVLLAYTIVLNYRYNKFLKENDMSLTKNKVTKAIFKTFAIAIKLSIVVTVTYVIVASLMLARYDYLCTKAEKNHNTIHLMTMHNFPVHIGLWLVDQLDKENQNVNRRCKEARDFKDSLLIPHLKTLLEL